MGNAFACLKDSSTDTAQDYVSPDFENKNLQFIWIVGQQNTGKKTHGDLIKEKFDFEHINVTDLLRAESELDTPRSKIIEESMRLRKRVNDHLVIQLLKETLQNSISDIGYVISNFPKNSRQADLFVREIANVNVILYLYADIVTLLNRAQARSDGELNETILKRDFSYATRDIKMSLQKFVPKIENVNTSGIPEMVFHKIEHAIVKRLHIDKPAPQEIEPIHETESEHQEPEEIPADVQPEEPKELEEKKELPTSSGDDEMLSKSQGDTSLKEDPSDDNRMSFNVSIASTIFEEMSSKISQKSDVIIDDNKETENKPEPHVIVPPPEMKEDEELLDSYYS